MTDPPSRPITRRRFIALVGGATGAGIAGWSLFAGANDLTPNAAAAGELTSLPPVGTAPPASSVRTSIPAATMGPGGPADLVDVLCREAWGARQVAGELVTHEPVRLTVHHTAAVPVSAALAPGVVREHQSFHQIGRGWPDLAYHFIIDAAGVIYEGRPPSAAGDTATDYEPAGHLLIACEGNFDRHGVPEAQLRSLIDLLAWAAGEYGIDPATISGHRDWAATACPGGSLYEMVASQSLHHAVAARLEDGPVGRELRCGPDAAAVVATIEAGVATEITPIPWDDRIVE